MNTQEIICSRRSIRSYTGGSLTKQQMRLFLKCANASPVGMGQYENVHLSVITNSELLHKIDSACAAFMGRPGAHPLYGAPVFVMVSAKINPMMERVAHANTAIIVHNMALEATELDVGSCYIWGAIAAINNSPDLLKELKLPEGFTPSAGLVLGQTDEIYRQKEISDKRIGQTVLDSYAFLIKLTNFIKKTSPNGAVESVILEKKITDSCLIMILDESKCQILRISHFD